jgi:hypothetical protein
MAVEYGLLKSPNLEQEMPAMFWVNTLSHGVEEAFQQPGDKEVYWGVIYSVLERAQEQVIGSLVCYATGRASAAEVVARTALEASLNLRYILQKNTIARLTAYFQDYAESDTKEIDAWYKTLARGGANISDVDSLQIQTRRQRNKTIRGFIKGMWPAGIGGTRQEPWPSIRDRYFALDEAIHYHIFYSRMCSQTHNSAEDLISHMIATGSGHSDLADQNKQQIAAFSRMMMYFCVHDYLLALLDITRKFGFDELLVTSITAGINYAKSVIASLNDKIGAPSGTIGS